MDDDFVPPSGQLVRLTVEGTAEELDLIAGCLFDAGAGGLVEEEGAVIVYTEGRQQLADFQKALQELRASLNGSSRPPIRWRVDAPKSDWQKKWQTALGPERVSPTFTLRPTHCSRGPDDENTLWFAPTASFGSGQHPTTRLAATAVEDWVRRNPGSSVCDVGTGTGVLAFIAARLGSNPVVALDTDAIAAHSARENARLNDLSEQVEIHQGGADFLKSTFDLVVSNMNTHILLPEARAIVARLSERGSLLLTGLLDEDVGEVVDAYASHGVKLRLAQSQEGWSLLRGVRI